MGSFLGGLVQGYAEQRLKAVDLEHQTEQQDKQNRVSYLRAAISSGQLTPDAMNAAIDELGDITGGGGVGKKGKGGGGLDILKKLAGHITQQQMPTPFEQRVQPTGGSRPETLGDIPQAQQRVSAEAAEQTPGHVDVSKMGLGSVPEPPARKIFKTEKDLEDEQIRLEKRRAEEVTGPEKREEEKARLEEETTREKAAQEREDVRQQAQDLRDDMRQQAMDLRLKNQQGFQLSLERLREIASENRERIRDSAMFRLTDVKASDALDKQARVERAKNITSTLGDLQKQLTQATNVWKAKTAQVAAMQKQAAANPVHQMFGLGVDFSQLPDVTAAQQDIENAKAAISYLTANKSAVIDGKADMDEVTAKTEDIMRNGQPQWSKSAWSAANPGKDADRAALQAMKQGLKVIP